jgi:hypothetical protein
MDIKYYREALHNYLILKIDEADTDSYQYKMLENNQVKGIIPFTIRRMDGETAIYYEIDSKQSIANMYSNRRIPYEKLKKLLNSIVEVTEEISRFFLDENHLMLAGDYIFEDLSTGSFYFLYNPDYENSNAESFFASLLEMIDINDQEASELIYDICERIKPEGPCFSMVIGEILKKKKSVDDTLISQSVFSEDDIDQEDSDDEVAKADEKRKGIGIKLPLGASMLMAALFAMVAGALWYIRAVYILTYEENLLDIVVFMVSVMMSLICFIKTIKASGSNKPIIRKSKRHKDDEEYEDDEDAKPEEITEVKSAPAVVHMQDTVYSPEEDDENEETVLLNFNFAGKMHKLYSATDGIQNIPLDNLPVVIGKLSSCADAVIKDPTVSRMHAKVFSIGGEMMLQDLNSKNGTFINGIRLLPNEKRIITADDEISFGKCAFSFR